MKLPTVRFRKPNLQKIRNNVSHNKRVIATSHYIKRRPFTAFAISLAVLLGIIILGNVVSNLTRKQETPKAVIKKVETYKIGDTARVTYQGQVENSGVITIVAQAPGVVSQINLSEGQTVAPGQTIISLASNYQGGNAPALQSQLANAQLQNVLNTYQTQKELIGKQREVAGQTNANSQQLAQIQANSIDDIQANLDLNNTILTTLYANLAAAQAGGDPAAILQAQAAVAQAQSGVTALNTQLQNAQLQASPTLPPTQLANLQKDITNKQLDVQERSLELAKQSAQIQANLAAVNAAVMYPASPIQGIVERVHVQVGDNVQPGTVLATVSGSSENTVVNVLVPGEVAFLISRSEPSSITIGSQTIKAIPYFVSTVPTSGQLYSALYAIPDTESGTLTENSYISVTIPLLAQMKTADPYVPIDSVYQTQESAYVYVVSNSKVKSKEVTLGSVFGQYAQIIKGLSDGDEIILSRNVVAGEKVEVTGRTN